MAQRPYDPRQPRCVAGGSYAITTNSGMLVSPFICARYSAIEARGYTEAAATGMTAPLTFNDDIRKTRANSSVGALLQLGKGQYINAQVMYQALF